MKYQFISILFILILVQMCSCTRQLFQFLQNNSLNIPHIQMKFIDSNNDTKEDKFIPQTKKTEFIKINKINKDNKLETLSVEDKASLKLENTLKSSEIDLNDLTDQQSLENKNLTKKYREVKRPDDRSDQKIKSHFTKLKNNIFNKDKLLSSGLKYKNYNMFPIETIKSSNQELKKHLKTINLLKVANQKSHYNKIYSEIINSKEDILEKLHLIQGENKNLKKKSLN